MLHGLGHEVELLGDGRELLERLLADPPDFVFNFAEGQGIGRCREARVPAVLEMLGIPYTGSDPLTLAATLDKDCRQTTGGLGRGAVPKGRIRPQRRRVTRYSARPCTSPSSSSRRGKGRARASAASALSILARLYAAAQSLTPPTASPCWRKNYIEGEEWTVGVIGNDRSRG